MVKKLDPNATVLVDLKYVEPGLSVLITRPGLSYTATAYKNLIGAATPEKAQARAIRSSRFYALLDVLRAVARLKEKGLW